MDVVFHASNKIGLSEIVPTPSQNKAEGRPIVCAGTLLAVAAIFLHNIGKNNTCIPGYDGKVVTLKEVYKNAFNDKYPEQEGSIYILPKQKFHSHSDCWGMGKLELFSYERVEPIHEIYIPNTRLYLIELQEQGLIKVDKWTVCGRVEVE